MIGGSVALWGCVGPMAQSQSEWHGYGGFLGQRAVSGKAEYLVVGKEVYCLLNQF